MESDTSERGRLSAIVDGSRMSRSLEQHARNKRFKNERQGEERKVREGRAAQTHTYPAKHAIITDLLIPILHSPTTARLGRSAASAPCPP